MAFVIAHRGASHDANENSASAIELAKRSGASAIEIDVRRTRDHAIVVMHDDDLTRSSGDSRRVSQLDLAEWKRLRQSFAPPFAPEPLLTLEEAWTLARPLPLVVEIKLDDDPDLLSFGTRVARFLTERADHDSTIISFEQAATNAAARALVPERVGLIRNTEYGEDGWRDLLASAGQIAVLSRRIVTAQRIRELRDAGKIPYVYALDDEDSVRTHVALGVVGIISNRPAIAARALL